MENVTTGSKRDPVVLIDRSGYSTYSDPGGAEVLAPERYAVRLVTLQSRLPDACGAAVQSTLAVPGEGRQYPLRDAVRWQLAAGGQKAKGLVALTERLLMPAAQLREEFDLPGPRRADVIPFRDKVAMKRHLRDHGIRVPAFAPFSERSARELLRVHGAVVTKPRVGAGSERVSVLRSIRDLEDLGRQTPEHAALEVEEYIDGPLFHVDSVVADGQVVAATAGRYLDPTTSYLNEMPLRSVAVPAGPVLEKLLAFNERVTGSFPEYSGVTHHEVFLAPDGPSHCEIAARSGGTGVAVSFWSRTGINLHAMTARAQLGDPMPAAIEVADHLTGWALLYRIPDGDAAARRLLQEPWVVQTRALPTAATATLRSVGDGSFLVTVRGDTEQQVTDRLNTVIHTLTPRAGRERADNEALEHR